jgi:hypothetical protein
MMPTKRGKQRTTMAQRKRSKDGRPRERRKKAPKQNADKAKRMAAQEMSDRYRNAGLFRG